MNGRKKLPQCEAELRRLHGLGYSDAALALALDVPYDRLRWWRAKLQLKVNDGRSTLHYRMEAGRRLRLRAALWGCDNTARWAAQRRCIHTAVETGWFGAANTNEAKTLDYIALAGQAGSAQIAQECNITASGAMHLLNRLAKKKMIRQATSKCGSRKNLWVLAPRIVPPLRSVLEEKV